MASHGERQHWEAMASEWEADKKRILHALGGSGNISDQSDLGWSLTRPEVSRLHDSTLGVRSTLERTGVRRRARRRNVRGARSARRAGHATVLAADGGREEEVGGDGVVALAVLHHVGVALVVHGEDGGELAVGRLGVALDRARRDGDGEGALDRREPVGHLEGGLPGTPVDAWGRGGLVGGGRVRRHGQAILIIRVQAEYLC